jgi:hypothetical protein
VLAYLLIPAAVPLLAIVVVLVLFWRALNKADAKDVPAIMQGLAAALLALFHWKR